jgi:hypothetical protein
MSYAAWVSSSDRALTAAAGQVRLIRAATPNNADDELALLERAFRRGVPRLPRWQYDPLPVPPELPRALQALATFLEKEPPLGPIYAARARELFLEAALLDAIGTPRLTATARQRFLGASPEEREDTKRADELAAEWTSAAPDTKERAANERDALVCSSDANDPRSLLSRLSNEVGRKRLPMRVVTQPGMASLAATGDGVILVAENKWLGRRDVERTVLHEIEGHALPRSRAAGAPLGIFAIGTARGIDDQEGRAVAIEEKAGFLDDARKFELGCRHLGARAALEGADFPEVVCLLGARGAVLEDALRIAARVQRGSQGMGGLAREVVYLPARCKVERLLRGPDGRKIEDVMQGGRIAADVALGLCAALSNEEDGRGGHFRRADHAQNALRTSAR